MLAAGRGRAVIDPKADSLDYGEMLNAPKGYELDFAICTTYTLDLEALVGAYIALGLPVGCDSALKDNPAHLFAAMARAQDKVVVFCEKGKIRTSSEYRSLYSQVEGGIVQVDLQGDNYPSFHPKVWLLRFTSQKSKAVKYRLCVLSRNLTLDGSWDIAASFDGEFTVGRQKRADGGLHLERALRGLSGLAEKARLNGKLKEKLEQMLGEVGYVYFGRTGGPYELVHPYFFVSGLPGGEPSSASSLSKFVGDRIATAKRALVMTPFLPQGLKTPSPIADICQRVAMGGMRPEDVTLIVRADALLGMGRDAEALAGMRVLAVRQELLDAVPDDAPGQQSDASPRDIHAKVFAFECEEEGGAACYVCAGSANATYRAMEVNHELDFALCSREPGAFDKLTAELGADDASLDDGIFARLREQEIASIAAAQDDAAAAEADRGYDHMLRRLQAKMDIAECADGEGFDVAVALRPGPHAGGEEALEQCCVGLLSQKTGVPAARRLEFRGLDLLSLTEFVRFTQGPDGSRPRLVRCDVTARAARILERRRAAVFGKIVAQDDSSLLDYLQFSLADNPEQQQALLAVAGRGGAGSLLSVSADGLYESLLQALSEKPSQALPVIEDCIGLLEEAGAQNAGLQGALALLEAFRQGYKNA